jgi:hypothetical protein
MADFTYGSHAGRGDSGSGGSGAGAPVPDLKRIVNLTGMALSAALMAGLVWWAWALMQRDVYGVPVVRALEGAMRESPTEPGGTEANHQGLAVARVQAEGMAAPPPAELTLAPAPMDLAPEDRPQAALLAERAAEAVTLPNATPGAAADAFVPDLPGEALSSVPLGEDADSVLTRTALDPVAPQVAPVATPVAVPETSIASSAIEAALAEALGLSPADLPGTPAAEGLIPASVPGVARSPRPAPRPEGDGIDTASAEAPVLLVSAAPAPQPWLSRPAPGVPSLNEATISVAPGPGRVVQLGAFDTPDQAEGEWQRLTLAHADLLGGRERTVERAVTNGRTFYRLRAGGFADLSEARRFCVALVANGAACIPVPQ